LGKTTPLERAQTAALLEQQTTKNGKRSLPDNGSLRVDAHFSIRRIMVWSAFDIEGRAAVGRKLEVDITSQKITARLEKISRTLLVMDDSILNRYIYG
jgi:hypothetical protein